MEAPHPQVGAQAATAEPTPASTYYMGAGRRLRDLAGAVEKAAPDAADRVRDLVDHIDNLQQRSVAAQVDADLRILRARQEVDRAYAELLRRGVATDLVPEWRREELAPEAEMRAGWPKDVALADRIRELEELLHASQRHEEDVLERLRGAENSRDQWRTAARNAGYRPDVGPRLADPGVIAEARQLEADRLRHRLREEESEHSYWRAKAEQLGEFCRLVPRLPAKPAKLHPSVLGALSWAVRPGRWRPEDVALPTEVVSEICRVVVEQEMANHLAHARVIGKVIPDEGAFRRGLEKRFEFVPPEATAGSPATEQGGLFDFDVSESGAA